MFPPEWAWRRLDLVGVTAHLLQVMKLKCFDQGHKALENYFRLVNVLDDVTLLCLHDVFQSDPESPSLRRITIFPPTISLQVMCYAVFSNVSCPHRSTSTASVLPRSLVDPSSADVSSASAFSAFISDFVLVRRSSVPILFRTASQTVL